jgi:hypothetical protein
MLPQKVLAGEAACLVDSCRAVAADVLREHAAPASSLITTMLDLVYKMIEPLRWKR